MAQMNEPVEITDANVGDVVLAADRAMVDFWEPRCSACQALIDDVDRFTRRVRSRVTVGAVNITECPDLARSFGVEVVPTILVFRNGEVEKRLEGLQTIQTFFRRVREEVPG